MKKIVDVYEFIFLSLTTYDKNCLKYYNISIILNINLLQYYSNLAIHLHYVTSRWAQRPKLKGSNGSSKKKEKEVMESFHVESSSFIQNLKAFIISNARQQVSVYCRHVESLGSFQYFQC